MYPTFRLDFPVNFQFSKVPKIFQGFPQTQINVTIAPPLRHPTHGLGALVHQLGGLRLLGQVVGQGVERVMEDGPLIRKLPGGNDK